MTVDKTPARAVVAATLTRADLIESLASNLSLDRQISAQMVDTFFNEVVDALTSGATVKLPGLGNFMVRDKKSRPGRNLRTGELVMIDDRRVVVFHPSTLLSNRVSDNLIPKGLIINPSKVRNKKCEAAEDDEE